MLKSILISACLIVGASPALADFTLMGEFRAPCNGVPPLPPVSEWREPSVPYVVRSMSVAEVQGYCSGGKPLYQPITACAARIHGNWTIAIVDILSDADRSCVLVYEKAHMPPSNWKDQDWENQATKGIPY